MDVVIIAVLGAGVGLGLFLMIAAIRGVTLFSRPPRRPEASRRRSGAVNPVQWLVGGVVCVVVWVVSGWPVAGVGMGVGAIVLPKVFGGRAQRTRELRRTDAIASWADQIRDTMSGAAGIEQAIIQTALNAPPAIAPELGAAARNLEVYSLERTLHTLADDLDHPSADMVIVSLVHAATHEAANVAEVLSRLAVAIRGDVRMRTRIEVGRARLRTAAMWTVAVSVSVSVYLVVFAREMVAGYDSFAGQAWLVVVFAVYAAAIWLFHRQARLDMPERFRARRSA
jgi:Flp pilus assembly protein TadB